MLNFIRNDKTPIEKRSSQSRTRFLVVMGILFTLLLLNIGTAAADNTTDVNATNATAVNTLVQTPLPNATATMAASIAIANATTSAQQPVTHAATSAPIPVITASPVPLPPINTALEQAFEDRNVMRMRNITAADRKAAAERAAAKGLVVGGAANKGAADKGYVVNRASNLSSYPGGTPDYWGPYPNYANSQLPTIDATGSNAVPGTGIRKFVDSLPGLTSANVNNLGQYIPIAVADKTSYPINFPTAGTPAADYYEIALIQYVEKMHSDLPPTTLRGYVQLETPVNIITSKHIPLFYPNGRPILNAGGSPVYAYDNPHYLGPLIIAQKDRPVRVKFHNYLPTGSDGNLFIPVDTTVMGAGIGPLGLNTSGLPVDYSQNRATIHLHGGNTPWISDGTPYQWTTPAGENTPYPKGVSVRNVPDMGIESAGTLTFYYTNQQSARLMFYHDHALGITRLNVYAGNAAGYLVQDTQEAAMVTSGAIPGDQIPLIIQDKTFVPSATQLAAEDPTWNWGGNKSTPWPHTGDLWWPHVYMPNQNPYDIEGANAMGRWDYGPWFWPPFTGLINGPVTNPYANPSAPWEPPKIPGTPNPSIVPEGFMDTPVVNGAVYPYIQIGPHAYRFRILNACNDRYLNLQLYYAGSNATMWSGTTLLNGSAGEVPMVPAVPGAGLPPSWPTDGRDGGVPNPKSAGPSWIQIGTEGGFLPAPVVLSPQPVSYDYNRRTITVLDVLNTSLYLGPAERADVIVDFTGIPDGTKLILYNDAPVPNPAFDPRYDYYTNDPDQIAEGGAPTTVAGYGPNTRTIMQIQINTSPAFAATGPYVPGLINTALPAAYSTSQAPPIIPQAAYNTAFTANYPADPYVRIQDTQTTFQPANQVTPSTLNPPITMELQPKSIIEDFDLDYGRMNAMLGVEVPRTTLQTQTSIPYFYVDPPTELFNNSIAGTQIGTLGDGTQIWKITHNGVDTHAIHWHMFNVQVLNRVGWDGAVKPPFAYELGWKETVKMRPLEDVIVAMRPINPNLPPIWGQLPNSIRPLDPTNPLGSATSMQFHNIDPNNNPAPVVNHLVNYGLEYVWHCHLLGHEEFDMMRAMAVAVAPIGSPAITGAGYVNDTVNKTNVTVFISFTDQSTIETHWTLQRQNLTTSNWTDIQRVPSYTGPQIGVVGIVSDSTLPPNSSVNAQRYRILAANVIGDATDYGDPAIGYPTIAANSTPSATIGAFTNNPANVTALFDGNPKTGVNAPLTVTFTDQSVGASGWSWNFGDGDSTNATGIQNPIHTYMKTGIYRVNLTTTSIGGYNTTSKPAFITVGPIVSPIAPVANFTATPVNGSAPLTVNFRDLSLNATTWYWTFGDNWMANGVNMSNSTLMNPVHTYLTAGNYTVSLNVTNSAGSNVTKKIGYINVTNSKDRVGVTDNVTWFLDYNGNGTWEGPSVDKQFSFGFTGYTPKVGDWNGDGRTKVGVYNDGTWYLDSNGDGFYSAGVDKAYSFGGPGNLSVVGDWNGDGRTKVGLFNPGTGIWYLDMNGSGVLYPAIDTKIFAAPITGTPVPVVGDWTGNGTTKIGVTNGIDWYLDTNGNGVWDGASIDQQGYFGITGYTPVVGDWTGNGTTKIGVTNSIDWYLDTNGDGVWDPLLGDQHGYFGIIGYIPVVGDWSGDGKTKIGVTNQVFWYLDTNGNGVWDGPITDQAPFFGISGFTPVVGKW